ncbi:hypothetical protein F8S09_15425 [Deinococcus sp. SDU3-2]|uniref:Uncharacterized protein n=1 Tax=Deinococcus terrestris TaxID=2651870 RepID=A0A7X1NZ58_9DEIO|nr:hypothetical protein [Deinococcus terrestris]MPY68046.1 hypothetical protein [Deinococcus terrestris]
MLQTLVAALWLVGAVVAGGLALQRFWRLGLPAPTETVIAMTLAVSFSYFWPRIRGFVALPSVFLVVMAVALVLALITFLLPILTKFLFLRKS